MRLLAIALGAALVSACGVVRSENSWPAYDAARPGRGAVLFRLNPVRWEMGETKPGVEFAWPQSDQEEQDYRRESAQRIACSVVPGKSLGRFPYDVLLIPLDAGEYTNFLLRVAWTGYEVHSKIFSPATPVRFQVKPGEVTVIGRVDFSAAVSVQNETERSREYTLNVSYSLDQAAAAKREALRAALDRPEAALLGWRPALERANAGP